MDDRGFRFIVQLSVKCSDVVEAEETLQAVKASLFREDESESDGELVKPKLLWSFFLVQEVSNPSQVTWHRNKLLNFVGSGLVYIVDNSNANDHNFLLEQATRGLKMCAMPDGTIDYRSMMKCTETVRNLQNFPADARACT